MFEKLVPDDQVMNIPCEGDVANELAVPYGACGIIKSEEGIKEGYYFNSTIRYKQYGCSVFFENYPSPSSSKNWFRARPGLMKITPDENLKLEESEIELEKVN